MSDIGRNTFCGFSVAFQKQWLSQRQTCEKIPAKASTLAIGLSAAPTVGYKHIVKVPKLYFLEFLFNAVFQYRFIMGR